MNKLIISQNNRVYYLDNLTFVLIIYMIFVHHQPGFCLWHNDFFSALGRIFSFFMAWFFYKGGMMYKRQSLK